MQMIIIINCAERIVALFTLHITPGVIMDTPHVFWISKKWENKEAHPHFPFYAGCKLYPFSFSHMQPRNSLQCAKYAPHGTFVHSLLFDLHHLFCLRIRCILSHQD
jgi:hypothetical protein